MAGAESSTAPTGLPEEAFVDASSTPSTPYDVKETDIDWERVDRRRRVSFTLKNLISSTNSTELDESRSDPRKRRHSHASTIIRPLLSRIGMYYFAYDICF